MKHFFTFSALLGALCLAAPVTGWSKDKHHHNHDHGRYDRSHDHHHHNHGSSIYYRSYRPYPYYGGYGYGYPYSYYSRPTFGVSVTTAPTYYSSARYSDDYDDDLAVDVQRALARRGYYRGVIDGDVGPGTRSAIRQYQYQHRLEVTGRIDRSLLRSLDLS